MVALVDALEGKGLVQRHADAADRRRNVVELTAAGPGHAAPGRRGGRGGRAPLPRAVEPQDAQRLKAALLAVIQPER